MLDKLAIIIVGKPNSGKTTTLKHYCNTYNYQEVTTFKQGWRHGIVPFKEKYFGIKIIAYFLPSSRTEKAEPLESIFKNLDWEPDFLFMAEQLNGSEYEKTIRFLREKNYQIKEYVLDENNSDSIWHFYNEVDEKLFQNHRTEQIADYVRQFIHSRI
jgi:GTPase SAR1 family protein